jgi:hypothetical protein
VLGLAVAGVVGGAGGAVGFGQTTSAPGAAVAGARGVGGVGGEVKREVTEVPVRRVVLFSSGVGFFQHAGRVSGNASTELRFKTDQINDILKSLVVSDNSAGGGVKSITYGSQNPVSRTLKSFQIDISGNPSLAGILNQIRGTKVSLALGDEKVEGTILGVEEKERPVGKGDDAKVVKTSYVNLITSGGIRSVQLDDVKKLEIQDEALQKELDQALAALAQARDKDKKPVIVNFDGTGDRDVSVAYLVETPVWKTSYRLILPDAGSKDSATLLGWAIVENQTDNDWNNVTLDLVGGRPISFIEDLYQPLYVPRPRVQPRTYASLSPQTYDEGLEAAKEREQLQAQFPASPPALAARASAGRGGRGGGGGGGGFGGQGAQSSAAFDVNGPAGAMDKALPSDFTQGVRSIAESGKVGEMFQYSVAGVSLPRQRSSMIPIISDQVPFDRVSIYNQSVLPRNALLGVRLKNQTKNYLLAGPLSILDKVKKADGNLVDSYAGDATIDDVPAGQERLLSYAVDQELLVDATKRDSQSRILTGSIVKGVLHVKWTDQVTQTYVLENKSDHEKGVVIEHPIQAGYELKAPAKALEKTEKVYRFQVASVPQKTGEFKVREERVRMEELVLLNVDLGTLDVYARSGEIPQPVKDVLQKAGEKRRAVADLERRMALKEQERGRVLQEEGNIRENIRVLPASSKTREDAINDLAARETSLKGINKEMDGLRDAIEKAKGDLDGYLDGMNVEG